MTSNIENMYLSRRAALTMSSGSVYRPLILGEIRDIRNWISGQLDATSPDVRIWELLWTNKAPFFSFELACLIGHDIYANLCYGADRVTDLRNGLKRWADIQPSFQALLSCLDRDEVDVFDAKWPVIVRHPRPLEAWRLGPRYDNDGNESQTLSELLAVDASDVLNVLLSTWEAGRPKAREARERLCDLLTRCVINAQTALSLSP